MGRKRIDIKLIENRKNRNSTFKKRRIGLLRKAMELSLLTQQRRQGAYGLAGGQPGATGRQWVERADGTRVELAAIDGCSVEPGDRLVLETPGGGAFGSWQEGK